MKPESMNLYGGDFEIFGERILIHIISEETLREYRLKISLASQADAKQNKPRVDPKALAGNAPRPFTVVFPSYSKRSEGVDIVGGDQD